MRRFVSTLSTLVGLLAIASTAEAQQFQRQAGALPGGKIWTEGIECADVDNDGDLDIFVADGNGFASAGTPQPNKLIINKFEVAAGTYANESIARLGLRESNARGVATGDVNGDGWIDALFANGFNNRLPSLFTNQGVGNPGFFNFSNTTSGFSEMLNSASAGFGDLDNDGDLDVIILDSGAAYLGGAGDRPNLYFNDGAGNFTENAAAMNATIKDSQMDVQFVDLDNDWDLDFFGPCRGSNGGGNHYLMLNDGAGNFTDVSSLIPNTSTNVYEAEVGDLDGDDDMDMFFLSATSMAEGHVGNNFAGTGSLTFTKGGTFGGGDDNEVALLDYDNDGDYDIFTGSLTNTEKMFRNNGGLSWTPVSVIQSISDSTLDCTVADIDNDGDYDLITGQGESNSNQFDNKVYLNNGSADTLAPVIVREEALAGLPNPAGPWVVRAQVRDQVMDDGKSWVTAEAEYTVLTTAQSSTISMRTGQADDLVVPVGTTITWKNPSPVTTFSLEGKTDGYRFASGEIAPGASFSRSFVRPGTYYYDQVNDAGDVTTSALTVFGTATTVAGLDMGGGGLYRFEMPDTDGGFGVKLVYELRFTDWAGNTTTSTPVSATLIDCGWEQYGLADSPPNTVVLDGQGSSLAGGFFTARASNMAGGVAIYIVAGAPDNYPSLGLVALTDPDAFILYRIKAVNGMGNSNFNTFLPASGSGIGGVSVYFQVLNLVSQAPDVWAFSNGLKLTLCP